MSKSQRLLQESLHKDYPEFIDLKGELFPKGLDIAREIQRKCGELDVRNGKFVGRSVEPLEEVDADFVPQITEDGRFNPDYLWPTIMSFDEKDYGLSYGFKTGNMLTEDCTLEEALPIIARNLGSTVNGTQLVVVQGDIINTNTELTSEEIKIMQEQEWGLPAVRITYLPNPVLL